MSTFKVMVDQKPVVAMTHADLTAVFEKKHPKWAAAAIASLVVHDQANGVHDADKDYIELDTKAETYKILDMDDAADESGIGGFDIDDYEDADDEEEAIESWIEDVEANLTGHVNTYRDGLDSQFLLLAS